MACRFRSLTCRHLAIVFSLAMFALFTSVVQAQTFDATHLRQPANLDAKWLVQAGDDPAYASPNFDDSHWLLFDPSQSINRLFPQHPEVIWYRLHLNVDPSDRGLALSEVKVARAFEVYVNGERLIASGKIAPFVPYTSDARLVGRIPDRMLASGSVVIALRVHFSRLEWNVGQNPGLYADNLAIGQERTLYRDNWLSVIGENALGWISDGLAVGLGFVALVLFAAQRKQTEYLWIFAVGVMGLVLIPTLVISQIENIPLTWMLFSESIRL